MIPMAIETRQVSSACGGKNLPEQGLLNKPQAVGRPAGLAWPWAAMPPERRVICRVTGNGRFENKSAPRNTSQPEGLTQWNIVA
jgi:hypothetical protein